MTAIEDATPTDNAMTRALADMADAAAEAIDRLDAEKMRAMARTARAEALDPTLSNAHRLQCFALYLVTLDAIDARDERGDGALTP